MLGDGRLYSIACGDEYLQLLCNISINFTPLYLLNKHVILS